MSSAVRVEVPRRKDFVKVALQAAADCHHSAVVPASTEQSFAESAVPQNSVQRGIEPFSCTLHRCAIVYCDSRQEKQNAPCHRDHLFPLCMSSWLACGFKSST